jgi:hypothetical protein
MLVCADMHAQDSLLDLAHGIEDRSDALRSSGESGGSLTRRLQTRAPWIVLFVPKSGIDDDGARKSGIREEDLANIRNRLRSWTGAAVIVYVIPGGRSITRLAEGIDVERQMSVTGNTSEVTVTVSLVRKNNVTLVSSVSAE